MVPLNSLVVELDEPKMVVNNKGVQLSYRIKGERQLLKCQVGQKTIHINEEKQLLQVVLELKENIIFVPINELRNGYI